MKPEDIKKAPKLFCESINIGYSPEFFVLAVSSGDQASMYTLTPQHAKRLQQYLTHQLTDYEKEHGVINTKWEPTIVSPVQRMNPPRDGS
jgi:hypothetical protein